MVLGWRRPGRVGRCRIPNEMPLAEARGFSFGPEKPIYPDHPSQRAYIVLG